MALHCTELFEIGKRFGGVMESQNFSDARARRETKLKNSIGSNAPMNFR